MMTIPLGLFISIFIVTGVFVWVFWEDIQEWYEDLNDDKRRKKAAEKHNASLELQDAIALAKKYHLPFPTVDDPDYETPLAQLERHLKEIEDEFKATNHECEHGHKSLHAYKENEKGILVCNPVDSTVSVRIALTARHDWFN